MRSTSTYSTLFLSVFDLRLIKTFSASAGGIRATIEGPNVTQVRAHLQDASLSSTALPSIAGCSDPFLTFFLTSLCRATF